MTPFFSVCLLPLSSPSPSSSSALSLCAALISPSDTATGLQRDGKKGRWRDRDGNGGKNREIKEEVKRVFEVDGVRGGLITQAFPPTSLSLEKKDDVMKMRRSWTGTSR